MKTPLEKKKLKLTNLQKTLRRNYVRVDGATLSLVVSDDKVHQRFSLGGTYEDESHANWMADMLAIALSRMVKAEHGKALGLK